MFLQNLNVLILKKKKIMINTIKSFLNVKKKDCSRDIINFSIFNYIHNQANIRSNISTFQKT